MTMHSSAPTREQSPHVNRTPRTNTILSTQRTLETNNDDSMGDKIDALAEIICRGADESPAALLVLMGTIETCADPRVLANTVKHYALARCGELNLFGIVDAQISIVEEALLAGIRLLRE
jgi:hypothetical protein